jgi:uncharacterized membrane protein
MTSLVAADNTWVLVAVIASGVAISVYLEERYRWAAKLSGPVIALLLAMLLTNLPLDRLLRLVGSTSKVTRILPVEAPAYDLVTDYLVPIAVVLLLLQANLRKILSTSRSMFVAFHVATIGTLVGTVLAAMFFRGAPESMPALPEASGMMAASYIGGGVNFIAVQRTYDISPNVANPLLVADNFVMAGIFLLLLVIADRKFFRRYWPHPHCREAESPFGETSANTEHVKPLGMVELAAALSLALCIAATSVYLAGAAQGWIKTSTSTGQGEHELPLAIAGSLVGSQYVWITLLTVAAATLLPKTMERLHSASILGTYLLYAFLFVIGLPAELMLVLTKVPAMFGFCATIAVTNLVFTLLVGKLLRLNLEELLLAVNATLGGAPTAAAMATAKGWNKLILPGLLVGVWGYVIGTFVGIVVVEAFRRVFF